MQKLRLLLLFSLIALFFVVYLMPPSIAETNPSGGNDWSMFRGNLKHTGSTTSAITDNSTKLLWNYTTGGSVYSSPAISDGCVFVGSKDGLIYCLNSSTGQQIWSFQTGSEVNSSPAINSGYVFFGSDDGWFYCLNAKTGYPCWIEWIGWNQMWATRSNPAISGEYVYVGSGDHDILCFNVSDGAVIWRFVTDRPVMSSPALSNGILYVAIGDFYVYAINASTGTELWRSPTGTDMSSPCIYNNCIYIGSYQGHLLCINASTGSWIWRLQTGNTITSSPSAANGCVYVGSQDNSIYCINASNGQKIWQTKTSYWVCSSPIVADGNLYVGSQDNGVYCLNAETGEVKWRYETGNIVDSSPAISSGVLYIGSHDNLIYAFNLGTSTEGALTTTFKSFTFSTIIFDVIVCAICALIIFTIFYYLRSTHLNKKDMHPNNIRSDKFAWINQHLDILYPLGLTIFSIIFFIHLGDEYLWVADEQVYSQIAFNMFKTGDYMTPYAYGELAIWTGKPPLLMWLMSISYQIFGVTNFSTRFFIPCFAALSLILVFYLGKKLFNRFVGVLSAIVLGSFTTFYSFSRHAMIDIPLVCLMLGSLYFFISSNDKKNANWYFVLSGFCFGLALLTKQSSALLIPAIIIVYVLVTQKSGRFFVSRSFSLFLGAAALVFIPWLLFMTYSYGLDFWNCFVYSTFTRAASTIEGHAGNYLYYFNYLVTSETLLWVILLPFAVSSSIFYLIRRSKADILLISWIAVVLLVFTIAQTKLYYYILPAYPAFALIIGNMLHKVLNKVIRKNKNRLHLFSLKNRV